MVGGVTRRDVGEARLDPHSHQRQQPAFRPRVAGGELGGTEADADLVVRIGGVRRRQVHRHVDVVAACFESRFEDRRIEPRIARIDDHIGA